jgi:hypothetical protein
MFFIQLRNLDLKRVLNKPILAFIGCEIILALLTFQDQYDDNVTKCVALFVTLFKKEITSEFLSKLVGILYLTGNTATAQIITDAQR